MESFKIDPIEELIKANRVVGNFSAAVEAKLLETWRTQKHKYVIQKAAAEVPAKFAWIEPGVRVGDTGITVAGSPKYYGRVCGFPLPSATCVSGFKVLVKIDGPDEAEPMWINAGNLILETHPPADYHIQEGALKPITTLLFVNGEVDSNWSVAERTRKNYASFSLRVHDKEGACYFKWGKFIYTPGMHLKEFSKGFHPDCFELAFQGVITDVSTHYDSDYHTFEIRCKN